MVNNVKIEMASGKRFNIRHCSTHMAFYRTYRYVLKNFSAEQLDNPRVLRVLSHRKHKEATTAKGLSHEGLWLWLLSDRVNYVLTCQEPEDFWKYYVSRKWRAQREHNMVRGLWTPQSLLGGRRLRKLLGHKHGFTVEGNQIVPPRYISLT